MLQVDNSPMLGEFLSQLLLELSCFNGRESQHPNKLIGRYFLTSISQLNSQINPYQTM